MGTYSCEEVEEIINQFGDMVYRLAFINVKEEEAKDIYQDVWMRLLQQEKEYIKSQEHLKAWLIQTTINRCRDYWRSSWVQRISRDRAWEETVSGSIGFREQEHGYVTECVRRLPERYKNVIHLYYFEGYTQTEIARILNESENTIASRMVRGRKRLRKMLEEEGLDYGF